jgi:aspartyl-tRNA(Asn)/glutamyl-tRNA(Gln) amidotransferase subunit A
MTGHPAITLPSGLHSTGLPMGIQLIGRQFGESALLRLASVINRNPDFGIPPASV